MEPLLPLLDDILAPLQGKVPLTEVARIAGVSKSAIYDLKQDIYRPSAATRARLRLAVARLLSRQVDAGQQAAATFRMAQALAAVAIGADPARVLGQDPARRATSDRHWLQAAEARRLAQYMLNVTLGFRQADVARTSGVSKQAVSQAVAEIEERRDDPAFDAMVSRLEGWLVEEL